MHLGVLSNGLITSLSTMLLPDAERLQGHWPLQWAALNNRYPVLQYLLSVCSYLPSTPLLLRLHALAPVPALPQKLYFRFMLPTCTWRFVLPAGRPVGSHRLG